MNSFLFKGKDVGGNARSERVTAENAQAAKAFLVGEGWSELQLVTDEICDYAGRTVEGPEDIEDALKQLTPDDELRFFEGNGPGFWSQYTDALYQAKGALLAVFLLSAWGIYRHQTWLLVVGIAGFGLLMVLFPLISIFYSLPMKYYLRLNRAKVWSRWTDVLHCVERLRHTHRLTRIAVGDVELARCRAQALAGLGRVDHAVKEFAQFENDPTLPHWNYLSFLAGVYDTAKEYEKALECRRRAVAEKPDTSAVWIDLAYGLVRGLNRPAEAREAVARAESLEITALGIPYLSFLRGIICWREGNLAEAREHLEKALPGFKPYRHNPLVEGLELLTKSYLCAVHGGLGDLDAARSYFRETKKFLEYGRETELLEVCRGPLSRE
jgi:tetratricopeptide (TPR) repeat protein